MTGTTGDDPQIEAALQARLDKMLDERLAKAVSDATAPLLNTIDKLRGNRDAILREKAALEGRAIKSAEERANDGPKPIDFAITKEQARDPAAYRRAKERAQSAGFDTVMILDPDATQEDQGAPPICFMTDDSYYCWAPALRGDPMLYRQHRDEAAKRGLRWLPVNESSQFPKEAFGTGGGR